MQRMRAKLGISATKLIVLSSTMLATALSGSAQAAWTLNMRPGVTEISNEIYDLHQLMLLICTVIGAVVFGLMFYSIFKHRKSQGHKAAQFHESTTIEIIWTVIPFIILIAMAIPATRVLVAMNDTSESQLTVKVTASQWKWHYEYLEYKGKPLSLGYLSVLSTPRDQIRTPSSNSGLIPHGDSSYEGELNAPEKNEQYLLEVDKPLVIPTGEKVRFLITADDVLHAFWVPDFGIKKDAIPGFINELWTSLPLDKTGTYRGQCAELCGADHGFMPIVVEAKKPEDFQQWLADAQEAQVQANAIVDLSMDELMTTGKSSYEKHCAACHKPDGTGVQGLFPALKDSPIAIGPAADHIDIVLKGKGGMPAFGGNLSAKELAAVITYERNAWGNSVGDMVQPKDIAAAK